MGIARSAEASLIGADGAMIYLPPDRGEDGLDPANTIFYSVADPGNPLRPSPRRTAELAARKRLFISGLLTGLGALASLALAVFLMAIGVGVFRFSRRGLQHHRLWVWLKLALTLPLTAASWWLIYESAAVTSTSRSGPTIGGSLAIALTMLALVSMAYPVALLIASRTRIVRAYHDTMGT